MAKMINLQCLILTPFLSTSTHTSKSLFPSQSFAISTKPISKIRFARSPIRPSLDAKASKTAAVPDNIMNVLGEVGIFTATGEPVKCEDLWDQMRLMIFWACIMVLARLFSIQQQKCSQGWTVKKAMKNYTIEATPDDRSGVLQQAGMFVFKGNQLLYARKDEGTGDPCSLG